jgi:AraC family transcriptional regulator
VSPFYFKRRFTILCGMTVGEYVRGRRLALAGSELASSGEKIIDIAFKYGYDSPDSFNQAFTRFHGAAPTAVRKEGAMVKSFARLKYQIDIGRRLSYGVQDHRKRRVHRDRGIKGLQV